MLIGEDNSQKLKKTRVAVFGIGGVGGYAVEALARSGVGTIDLIDYDDVADSNLNRQIIALQETIGQRKIDVMAKRIAGINPEINVVKHHCFYLPEKKDVIPFDCFDYIVDAIDTITAKLDLIVEAGHRNIPIISAMGCGNRLDPGQLVVTDIYQTKGDPLSRVMRHELRKRKIKELKVVYSTEKPIKPIRKAVENRRKDTPGSMIFVPASAGLLIASVVVRDICRI